MSRRNPNAGDAAVGVIAFLLIALLALYAGGAKAQEASPIPTRYDALIREASAEYLPWRWTWLKAQLYAESRLDPAAVSRVGARGLGQLMPATHREIARALNRGAASPHDVEYAIEAAAYYMRRMRRVWLGTERPEDDRRRLAQASYNAGAGNIIAAQRRCSLAQPVRDARLETIGKGAGVPLPCVLWAEIALYLPEVTGRANSAETTGYVARIERLEARIARSL